MDRELKEIESIIFGVSSPEEIKASAVCKIESTKMTDPEPGTVYDPAMGPCFDNVTKCPTCGEKAKVCTGHFGYIELNYPIIHPLFYKNVSQYLKCICIACHRLLLTKEQIELYGINRYNGSTRFNKILERLEKVDICCRCKHTQPVHSQSDGIFTVTRTKKDEDGIKKSASIVLSAEDILEIFDDIHNEDIILLGMDPKYVHPRNFILQYLPVIPSCARPPVIADGNISDDDLTAQYIEIIKKNNDLANCTGDPTDILGDLKFNIEVLFDNSKGRAKHNANNREKNTFKDRLSGKGGLIRNNLMGKRVDQSARTVIGPDPTLKIDEIGLPQQIADTLTFPEHVTSLNIEKMMKLVNEDDGANFITNLKGAIINLGYALYKKGTPVMKGDFILRDGKKIKVQTVTVNLKDGDLIERAGNILNEVEYPQKRCYKLQIGEIVHRKLQKGDIVLLNRQPTLHSGSMMAMRVVPRRGHKSQKTITMNLAATKSFNADFDGDEMNIHAPQSLESVAELQELSSIKNFIISTQSSTPNIVIVQDSLLGAYKMTGRKDKIEKGVFYQISAQCDFSSNFVVRRLRHIRKVHKELGLRAQAFTGKGLFSLLLPEDFIYENENKADPDEPVVKIYKGVLLEGTITKANLGGSNKSLILLLNKEYPKDVVCSFIDNLQFMTNAFNLHFGFSVGLGDCIATRTEEIEDEIQKCLIEAEGVEHTTHNPGIREVRVNAALNKARDIGQRIAKDALSSDNNFISTVTSGSKGDFFNIAQITGLLGQQCIDGERIPLMLNNGTRSLPHYNPDGELSLTEKYEARGFIRSSFIRGLNPREFFFHACAGRKGICDTAMGTATSGYTQRKIAKCTEDIMIKYGGTVRDATGAQIQLCYGSNGYDPAKAINIKGEAQCCDVSRIAARLAMKRED